MNSRESNGAPDGRYDRLQHSASSCHGDRNDVTAPEFRGHEWWELFWADALDRLKHHLEE